MRALLKRFAPLIIALSLALLLIFVHLTIEVGRFEHGPLSKNGFLNLLELKALDVKFQSRDQENLPEPKVVVAAIDEKGLEQFGLWPWSRRVIAQFVEKATEAGAKVVAFDAVFGDEDKNSSYVSIKRFLQQYDADDLSPESPGFVKLTERLAAAEKLETETTAALAELERKLQNTPNGQRAALAATLKRATALQRKHKDAVSVAKAQTATWAQKSAAFRTMMEREVAAVSPDEALAAVLAKHADKVVQGYHVYYNEREITGVEGVSVAKAMERIGRSGVHRVYETGYLEGGIQVTSPAEDVSIADLQIRDIVGAMVPLATFAEHGKYFGYYNMPPDRDGAMRRARLFNKFEDTLYPALSLQAVATYYDSEIRPLNSEISPGSTLGGVASLDNSEEPIPTNGQGHFYVNYYTTPETYFPTYSVASILDGSVGKAQLEGKLVLFGMTALGLFDLRPTPFSPVTPGVYIHAQVAQNILDHQYLQRPFGLALLEALGYLVLALIMGLTFPRLPAWGGLLATSAFIVTLFAVDLEVLFPRGIWFYSVLPTLQVVLTFVGINVYGFLTEGREKRQIRKAFQFYLTKSVVDQVLKNPDMLKLGGQKSTCTVLFSDVRGFTTISEKLSPEELVALLNEYLTPMTDLVFKYEGTLDKYMGDAIMAIFGAPINHGDHALKACQCSLEMLSGLHVLQEGWRARGLPELDIGIGLNTGPMSVGNMGSTARFDYTVMGDNVNLGSRLEGINKQYGTNIIISEFTYQAVVGKVAAREMDSVRVKGKREPVKIYELMADGSPAGTNLEIITEFERGIALYKGQKWDDAIAVFERIRTTLKPRDYASGMYIERCETMRQDPPGQEWDGVYTMTTK